MTSNSQRNSIRKPYFLLQFPINISFFINYKFCVCYISILKLKIDSGYCTVEYVVLYVYITSSSLYYVSIAMEAIYRRRTPMGCIGGHLLYTAPLFPSPHHLEYFALLSQSTDAPPPSHTPLPIINHNLI
jgi:hypothetical protein